MSLALAALAAGLLPLASGRAGAGALLLAALAAACCLYVRRVLLRPS